MCTFHRNHCSTICLLGQHSRPTFVPLLLSLSLFSLAPSSTNEAMKQPIVRIFLADSSSHERTLHVERVLLLKFNQADQENSKVEACVAP